jgi:AcrR family transcriptional regulator
MSQTKPHDPRHAIAEGNTEAILDGAQRVLQRGERANISAVAAQAGVSRPTVYAHFHDLERLLEALVERTVQRTMAAIESAEPERGPAVDALQRLLVRSWEELSRHEVIARASAGELSADAMRRAHQSARAAIEKLVERGRREGAFRTDLAASWLVTCCLALIHAAAEEVRAGELDSNAAVEVLSLTIVDLLAAPGTSSADPARQNASRLSL